MISGFDEIQKISKDNMDVALASAGAVSKGYQALAVEAADYTKKSFAASSTALEKVLAAHSLDKAVEIQSDYVRTAYEDYAGQVSKLGELFVGVAKDFYKPYESFFGRLGK